MILLTPEERRISYSRWPAQSMNIYWEDWLVRAQLRKVIAEIEAIYEDFPDAPDDFMRNVLLLVDGAKKEIG